MTRGHNSMLNWDLRSYFNVESRPGITIQPGIMSRGHISTWNLDQDHNSTWNYDPGSHFNVEFWPGSQFNVELWPWVKIQRWIMTRVRIPHWIVITIPGHNLTLNHDSGSKFNVELIPRVIIQRGIKTQGHNSTGGPNFIRRRGRNSMTPCLWGRNSTWKIRLNPEHSPLNQDPTGRNSMGSKLQSYTGSVWQTMGNGKYITCTMPLYHRRQIIIVLRDSGAHTNNQRGQSSKPWRLCCDLDIYRHSFNCLVKQCNALGKPLYKAIQGLGARPVDPLFDTRVML